MRKAWVVSACMVLVASRVAGAQLPEIAKKQTYVWTGQLVAVDEANMTVTLQVPISEPVLRYVDRFKPGDRVMITWVLKQKGEAGPVLHLAELATARDARLDYGYILPVEFVSADAAARTVNIRTPVAPEAFAGFRSIQPGRRAKVTSPMVQAAETAAILKAEPGDQPEATTAR